MNHIVMRAADEFLGAPIQHPGGGPVDESRAAVAVELAYALARDVEEEA